MYFSGLLFMKQWGGVGQTLVLRTECTLQSCQALSKKKPIVLNCNCCSSSCHCAIAPCGTTQDNDDEQSGQPFFFKKKEQTCDDRGSSMRVLAFEDWGGEHLGGTRK